SPATATTAPHTAAAGTVCDRCRWTPSPSRPPRSHGDLVARHTLDDRARTPPEAAADTGPSDSAAADVAWGRSGSRAAPAHTTPPSTTSANPLGAPAHDNPANTTPPTARPVAA